MEQYQAYVVNGVVSDLSLDDIAKNVSIATQNKVSSFQFDTTPSSRSLAFVFENKITLKAMKEQFPEAKVYPVVEFDDHVSRNTVIYLTNFPEGVTTIGIQQIVKSFGETVSYGQLNYMHFFMMQRDYHATCIARILPYVEFQNGHFKVYLDYKQIPIIHVSQISKEFKEEDVIERIKSVKPVLKYYSKPKEDNFFTLNVLFDTIEDSNAVIKALNFMEYGDDEVLLTPYVPHDVFEKMKSWQLKIDNLSIDVKCKKIYEHFIQYGPIFSVNIFKKGSCTAYILFMANESATKAKENEQNVTFVNATNYNMIYVSHLPHNVKQDEIKQLFPKAANIQINPNANRGFPPQVILSFENEEDGKLALEKGNQTFVRGIRLLCNPRISKENLLKQNQGVQDKPDRTIVIKNLEWDITFEEVAKLCAEFGTVDRLSVKNGPTFSTAIAQYTEVEMAQKAIKEMVEYQMNDRWVSVEAYNPMTSRNQAKHIEQRRFQGRGGYNK